VADFTPMLTAIRECLLGTIGSTRAVDAGDLREGAYPSTVEHEAARSVTGPRFEVSVLEMRPSSESPWEHSPTRLIAVEIQVRTEWSTEFELQDEERSALRASALSQLEECRAALMRAGNLTATSEPLPTGIVSGCLHRCLGHRLEREDWPRRRLSYLSRYATIVQIAQTAG
jgi:hypothetical protein